MTVSLWLPIPHLKPSLLSSFGDSLRFIACSPSGIIHQISDLSVNTPARAENTALRCFFFCVCLIFKLAIRNALKWGVCCPNPSWIHSMFFFFFALLFSIQPLPVSVSDCRSECVWEGESKFFHGSSQPLAHGAAKWVTVYPLSQLRVLMCESVYVEEVWICLACACVRACVTTQQRSRPRAQSLSFSLFFSAFHTHTHAHSSIVIGKHAWEEAKGHCEKTVGVKEQRFYGAEKS